MIEPASNPQYHDANKLANVVLPGEPNYAAIMRGEPVAPDPVNAKPRKPAETAAQVAPAWGAPSPPAAPTSVPWAEPSAPPPAKAAGPDWLNT